MKTILLCLVLSCLSALGISPEETPAHFEQQERVVGVVAQVKQSARGDFFLNFGGKYPNEVFTVVIYSKDSEKFKDVLEFEGKKVSVIGLVKGFNGKPQIIVTDPDQIRTIL